MSAKKKRSINSSINSIQSTCRNPHCSATCRRGAGKKKDINSGFRLPDNMKTLLRQVTDLKLLNDGVMHLQISIILPVKCCSEG
jgi:hypothetical protein